MIERSACRVDKIADSVLKDVLSIRAIPDRGRGPVLPMRREVAGPIRVGKRARKFERVENAFMRVCPPYGADR